MNFEEFIENWRQVMEIARQANYFSITMDEVRKVLNIFRQ